MFLSMVFLWNSNRQHVVCLGDPVAPLLFLVNINDLPNISEVLQFYLFADDANIYYEAESIKKLKTVINKELRKLDIWPHS